MRRAIACALHAVQPQLPAQQAAEAAITALGQGISLLPAFIVAEQLASGELVRVLPGWTVPSIAIHAVYLQTPMLPSKTRALVDFLVEHFGPEPELELQVNRKS